VSSKYDDDEGRELVERVVNINRVAKVVKGGRNFSFTALVVVGDRAGKIGVGYGKANEVPEAIRKGAESAKRHMVKVPVLDGTIPHEIIGRYGAARVVMRPASLGTSIIAGGAVRDVMEAAGIKNVLTKSIGSSSPINIVKATMNGFARMKTPQKSRALRGLPEPRHAPKEETQADSLVPSAEGSDES